MLTKDKLAETLLNELKEECFIVLSLLNQLDTPGISETQEDEILGELSARLTHLEIHARERKKKLTLKVSFPDFSTSGLQHICR